MKKILFFAMMMVAGAVICSCSHDDHYDNWHSYHGDGGYNGGGQSGALNQWEQQLVGSYVSTDNPADVFSLTLSQDRTGNFTRTENGTVTESRTFSWSATQSVLNISYTDQAGGTDQMNYSINGSNYTFGQIPYSRATSGSDSQTAGVTTQWRGSLLTYYKDLYGLDGNQYATVMQFMGDSEKALSGTGWQLDFDIDQPQVNYAYNPYVWTIQGDTAIIINYVGGSTLSPSSIKNYKVTETDFRGKFSYLATGAQKTVDFNFVRTMNVTVPEATRGSSLLWTSVLNQALGTRLDAATLTRQMPTAVAKSGGTFASR